MCEQTSIKIGTLPLQEVRTEGGLQHYVTKSIRYATNCQMRQTASKQAVKRDDCIHQFNGLQFLRSEWRKARCVAF